MEERKRITEERKRIQKTLHLKGFPTHSEPPLSVPSIKEINVHGLWDGIVGHPVDVKINLMVCLPVRSVFPKLISVSTQIAAQPNIRHAILDVTDSSVVQGQAQSVEKVSTATREVVHSLLTSSTMKERLAQRVHGNAEGDVQRKSPNIPKESSKSSDQQTSHGHLNEWSGDTLVESEARAFLGQQRLQYLEDQINGREQSTLAITKNRRLYPSLRSGMSPTQIHQRDWFPSPEECEALINGSQDVHSCQSQSRTAVDNQGLVRNNDLSGSRTSSSSGRTVEVYPTEQQKESLTSPAPHSSESTNKHASSDTAPLSLASNASMPSRSIQFDSPSPATAAKRTRLGNKPIERKPWQTPSQEDFSPRNRIRIRAQKPVRPSPIRVKRTPASDSKTRRGIESSQSNRVRSRSLDHMDVLRGVCLGSSTPGKTSTFKRSTCTVGRASGRRNQKTTDERLIPVKPCNDTPHNVPTHSLSPLSQRSSGESGQDSPSASRQPSQPHSKSRTSSTCHTPPTPVASDVSLMVRDPSPRPVRQSTTPIASSRTNDNDGYHSSRNRNKREDAVSLEFNAGSSTSTPDSKDRPWLRRVFPSSRYFSSSPATSPAADKPFWIHLDGKLYICFPSDVESGTYRMEIQVKVHLTERDEEGWYGFSIPGLPQLQTSQPGGHFSFRQDKGDQVEIDRSFFNYTINDSPYLVSGVSHFGTSPLLRLRFRMLPQMPSFEHKDDIPEQCIDRSAPKEQRDHLRGFGDSLAPSLKFLELPPHELTRYPSEEMKTFSERGVCNASDNRGREKLWKQDWQHTRPLTTPPRYSIRQDPETSSRKQLQVPIVSPVGFRPLPNSAGPDATGTQLLDDKLSEWANQKINLCPAHFAGLYTRDDPLELEDPTKLSWNLDISINRNVCGELECQTSLEVLVTTLPLLTIDAHDWIPSFSTINGRLATQCEWRETEDGDLALWKVPPGTKPGKKSVKIRLWWKEIALPNQSSSSSPSPSDKSEVTRTAREYILPTITDKIILTASLTCNVDNALLVLNDREQEEMTWRADSMIGSNSIVLPKLHPGYRLRLNVDENVAALPPPADGGEEWDSVPDWGSPPPPLSSLRLTSSEPRPPPSETQTGILEREKHELVGPAEHPEPPRTTTTTHHLPFPFSPTTTRTPSTANIMKSILLFLFAVPAIFFLLARVPEQALHTNHPNHTNHHYTHAAPLGLTGQELEYHHQQGFGDGGSLPLPFLGGLQQVSDGFLHEEKATVQQQQVSDGFWDEEKEEGREKSWTWRDRVDRALGWRELDG